MKRANSQEPKSETSHSCFADVDVVAEQAPSGNAGRSKSAAVLGLALSFGASGVLFADSEATAAVGSFVVTNPSASSESPQLPSVLNSQLAQPSTVSQGLTVYHTVEQGDSLWQIAKEHRVEIQDIKVANRISPDEPLQVGQVIKVPNEEPSGQPTLVSLLPGVQGVSGGQAQQPSLERLVAGIADDRDATSALQQPEASVTVEKKAVVADEELTGAVSLRSAGLVSQSDGFQADLEQLASNNSQVVAEPVAPAASPAEILQSDIPAAAPEAADLAELETSDTVESVAAEGYQFEVRPGDTVEAIATSLGTTADELAEANGLDNPDFIVAGETLALPEDVTKELAVSEAATSLAQAAPEIAVGGFDGTRLSRLQSTVENPIDASSVLGRLQGAQQAEVAQSPEIATDKADVSAVEDPYTADLLADVSSAQQIGGAFDADSQVALRQAVPSAQPVVVNPEFQASRLETAQDVNQSSQRPELLAAAPLDPSVYVSSPAPATGQVVSPEMPILPSADEYLPEAPDYFNGYIWPARGTLTSGYGWRWGRMHRGIDVAGPVGTPIVSAASGVVERAGWNSGGYGNLVEVRHADGSMTRYAHNSRIIVRSGQRVTQGQHIADMGSTGYSTGPHLHFEVHLPERGTVNPMAMLPGR
ncbi:MAG: peptidoglycan DD-metalloendopeptidase family protein [Leptolyngbyaceae cyanobacterium]